MIAEENIIRNKLDKIVDNNININIYTYIFLVWINVLINIYNQLYHCYWYFRTTLLMYE